MFQKVLQNKEGRKDEGWEKEKRMECGETGKMVSLHFDDRAKFSGLMRRRKRPGTEEDRLKGRKVTSKTMESSCVQMSDRRKLEQEK